MAAKPTDAKEGYLIFLKNKGRITLAEINELLLKQRFGEVSQRMYEHYRRLLSHGFRYYIPINHLDVYLSLGTDRLIAERRRFHRENSGGKVDFSFNGEDWFPGGIVDISSIGFGIVTNQTIVIPELSPMQIRLDGHRDIPGDLVWKIRLGGLTRIGVRAHQYISNYRKDQVSTVQRPRPKGKLVIVRTQQGEIDWQRFNDVVNRTNQFIIALEDFVYRLSEATGQQIILVKPTLESIEFHSPGEGPIKVDLGIAEFAKIIIDNIFYGRFERRNRIAQTKKLEAEAKKADLEVIHEAVMILGDAQTQGNDQIARLLREKVGAVLGSENIPPGLLEPGTPERGVLENRVIPTAKDLIDSQEKEYQISVDQKPIQ